MDKRSEFLYDIGKLEFKLNVILRGSEIRQYRPLCYPLIELYGEAVNGRYSSDGPS